MKYMFLIISLVFTMQVLAQDIGENFDSKAENTVIELYDLLSADKDEEYDWEKVRALFHDDAIILLRTSLAGTTRFDLDGFIADFQKFVKDYNILSTGFTEEIIKTQVFEFGDIAHIVVLYEAYIPKEGTRRQQGVDSIQLIRVEGEWKVFSIINEVPMKGRPLPLSLAGQKPKV